MDKNHPSVSVIVPIYRIKQEYLEQCIESLVLQTYQDIEIILIDDGSPDNCGKICDLYAERYAAIRVIHKENEGVSAARNLGIDVSQGEYIMFVDADDWLERDCIETVLKEIQLRKAEVLYFQRCKEGLINQSFPPTKSRYLDNAEITDFQICALSSRQRVDFDPKAPWGKIIRRDYCIKNHISFPPGVKKAQDVIFNLYLLEYAASFYCLDYVGYHHRLNPGSINVRYNPEIPDAMVQVLSECDKFINKFHSTEQLFLEGMCFRSVIQLGTIEKLYTLHSESNMTYGEIKKITLQYWNNEFVRKYINYFSSKFFDTFKYRFRYYIAKNKLFPVYYFYRIYLRKN